jgi:uncharacterized protein (UPF0332 family)
MDSIVPVEVIERKIYLIRGQKVMLDKDLAILYCVKPIRLREQVKRNIRRFPDDFMFQLNEKELDSMVSQNAIPSRKYLGGYQPYVFTEQGVAMLRSARAFMLLKGFRPSDGYQHKTVVDFMFHSLGKELKEIVELFDRMRRKRNIFTYEIDISISRTEADNAFDTAVKFVNLIKDIIKKENPQADFGF